MKQPARNRESGQRPSREELAPGSGFGRMAEIGALATAASAVAIGALEAREHAAALDQVVGHPAVSDPENMASYVVDPAPQELLNHEADAHAPEPRLVEFGDAAPAAGHATPTETFLDPSVLTARIAEQIASSVTHVLNMAGGGQGTAQTLSRDIVEQAQNIAHEVHGQFTAQEPLSVLADLVPPSIGLDTLSSDIIAGVDQSLADSGVIDLLHGATAITDPHLILDGVMANLNGLELPIDVAALTAVPTDIADAVPADLLGGVTSGQNPLADLFYDDGGADVAQSAMDMVGQTLSEVVAEAPKPGFLAQPLDLGDELGGLTHGNGGLSLL